MIRRSFHVFIQCKQVTRGLHTAFPRKYVVNASLIQNLSIKSSKKRAFLTQIPVRFSSSGTEVTETIKKETPSISETDAVSKATEVSTTAGTSGTPIVPEEASIADVVDAIEYIPPPPPPPEALLEVSLTALGEPSFASYGIGLSWWPKSWMLNFIEFIHVQTGLPWWGTIGLTTILVRTFLLPVVIRQQRASNNFQNAVPTYQHMQTQLSNERQAGNYYEASKIAMEIEKYSKTADITPWKMIKYSIVQMPFFISLFLGLRECATTPVEAFKTGGLWWFTDLTATDPYYVLPVMSVGAMLTLLMFQGGSRAALSDRKTKMIIGCVIPLIAVPMCMALPAGTLCYIVSTNCITVLQVAFLRVPVIQKYFQIPDRVAPVQKSKDKRPFWVKMKEDSAQQRIAREVAERAMYDDIAFKNAARGGVQKTYKTNPLAYRPKQKV